MRFCEWFRDFGRSICGSSDNGGFKKSAAYQTSGRKDRVKNDVKKWPCPVMGGIFQDAIYVHAGVSSQCFVPRISYKSRVVYFSSVEFFKQHNVYGFRCQCSGVRRRQRTACDEPIGRELRTETLSRVEDKGQSVSVFCHLSSDFCHLFSDT